MKQKENKKEDWREELNNKIKNKPDFVFYDCDNEEIGDDLESFISSLLKKQREEIIEKIKERGDIDSMCVKKVIDIINSLQDNK